MRIPFLLWMVGMIFLAGCQGLPWISPPQSAQPVPKPASYEKSRKVVGEVTKMNSLEAVSWADLPAGLFEDRTATWADALEQSAIYYRRLPAEQLLQFGPSKVTALQMHQACSELAQVARSEDKVKLQKLLQERFRLYRSVGNATGDVLVTGYYEPLLHGSFTRSKRYFYPIYRRPPDKLRHFNRKQIDGEILKKGYAKKPKGALANRHLELVWVDNPIDAFFLHIQGSGRVLLDNGRQLRIGYDSTNGHPYLAIGKILIEEGKITKEEMTMLTLRQWLINHPAENQRLFFANPSYVYFRELTGDAVGNINVPLTKDRSIATDHRLFPKGAPAILATTVPVLAKDGQTQTGWRPEVRFVVNQDTGGAIRGAGRVDLFFGFGKQVDSLAGVMKQPDSQLYFIAPIGK